MPMMVPRDKPRATHAAVERFDFRIRVGALALES